MNKYIRFIFDKPYRFGVLNARGFYNHLSDEEYLKRRYRVFLNKELNLDNPQTLNEKMQWLKLHDRKPEYTRMVDKFEAKQYVAERIGEEYVIPTIGVWESFDQIDFDSLPNQFVLKCTHDSGGLVICRDKETLNYQAVKRKIEKSLSRNYYWSSREWPYKNVRPRIIAEPYMCDESGIELKDYKIFCFNGRPEYVEVDFNRHIEHKLNPYDFDWNPLNFCDSSKNDYSADIPKPSRLEDMRRIAEKLSDGIRLIRIDFYSIGDKIYVGELTFFPGSGFIQFEPESTDLKYGKMLSLEEM